MRFGPLQKYILLVSRSKRGWIDREIFLGYYQHSKKKPSKEDRVNSVTKALEKMVRRNLMVASGVKTSEKFFINTVKLTPEGRKAIKNLLGSQQRLPINSGKNNLCQTTK